MCGRRGWHPRKKTTQSRKLENTSRSTQQDVLYRTAEGEGALSRRTNQRKRSSLLFVTPEPLETGTPDREMGTCQRESLSWSGVYLSIYHRQEGSWAQRAAGTSTSTQQLCSRVDLKEMKYMGGQRRRWVPRGQAPPLPICKRHSRGGFTGGRGRHKDNASEDLLAGWSPWRT